MVESDEIRIGIVGVGLMGASIAAAMLLAGHKVVGLSPVDSDIDRSAYDRIKREIDNAISRNIAGGNSQEYLDNLKISRQYSDLSSCNLVIESVIENLQVKREVLQKIEDAVKNDAIIGTNTSAIPINTLQKFLIHGNRFFGLHWSEPACTSKFLEIICGDESDQKIGEKLQLLAVRWNKEPTLLRKDIRGFVTNRLMYALYREAFYLVENGYATMEDIDRACRNDGGVWMAFCGPFRYMDLTGLQAYYHVMKDLFPTLSNQKTVPEFVEKIALEGGNGISNGRGFYQYAEDEQKEWDNAYAEFNLDMFELKEKHPPESLKKKT